MIEFFLGIMLTTSVQLYISMNDNVAYIKADQVKVYLMEKKSK